MVALLGDTPSPSKEDSRILSGNPSDHYGIPQNFWSADWLESMKIMAGPGKSWLKLFTITETNQNLGSDTYDLIISFVLSCILKIYPELLLRQPVI